MKSSKWQETVKELNHEDDLQIKLENNIYIHF